MANGNKNRGDEDDGEKRLFSTEKLLEFREFIDKKINEEDYTIDFGDCEFGVAEHRRKLFEESRLDNGQPWDKRYIG